MNAINNGKVRFTNEHAPLAEALLDAAQLYATRSNPWFNSTFANSAFMDDAATKKSRSVCYFCQATAVLMISDGQPTTDGIIPGLGFAASPMTRAVANTTGNYAGMAGYNITEISDADCPVCNTVAEAADTTLAAGECLGQQLSGACASTVNPFPIPSYLPKVAWYLRNMDFRDDNETAPDGFKNKGKQNITTYTIGLATRGNTSLVLEHTATAGGGFYNGGSGSDVTDAKTLREAILRVMEDVNTRSTSFGAASLSTLQASASQGVLVPRFEPSRSAHWNGHLYAFDLYSEFTGDAPACHIPTSGRERPGERRLRLRRALHERVPEGRGRRLHPGGRDRRFQEEQPQEPRRVRLRQPLHVVRHGVEHRREASLGRGRQAVSADGHDRSSHRRPDDDSEDGRLQGLGRAERLHRHGLGQRR